MKNLIALNNRYFLSTAMLFFILLLIDDTTFYKLYKMKQELHSLELENIKKEKEIIQIKEKTKQLTTNKFALEKFAREHYLMKKNDEVIYVFDNL
ncbi:MAG: septum formation initiator family protein [Flavobacteriales bacterium]|nr:septum formation initiator family protein [Flavobacteriales bacterium]